MSGNWPFLREYEGDHLARVAMPLGGIGTGTISLGGRGDLRDWEIVNRPAKGFKPSFAFFALRAKPAGGPAVTRLLEGPAAPPFDDERGFAGKALGLPRFRKSRFRAAYPLGQVLLSDPDVPLEVRIEAFNPLLPCDADASGIPVMVLRVVMRNRLSRAVAASVCGSVHNFIGTDGTSGQPKDNLNQWRSGNGLVQGVFMSSRGLPPESPLWGTMVLATTTRRGVSWRTAWHGAFPPQALHDFWEDFSADGALDARDATADATRQASLAVSMNVPPRATRSVTFLLAWHFPNRQTWTPVDRNENPSCSCRRDDPNCVGNYYATLYRDAWDVAERTAASLQKLEDGTVAFVRSFCDGDLPACVKEAALFNLPALRSQTCFRTRDGMFFGWEGCLDREGCCSGSCTHVWNYEQATAFLFGDLSRRMREVEFIHATNEDGFMVFRTPLPLGSKPQHPLAAADGQMGCVLKLYRDWQLSGDDAMLRRLWPKARKAIEFAWAPDGWDADRDGVMEGCQHNTTDLEFFGPNTMMGTWYLGALRAAEAMARHVGEVGFASVCHDLSENGRAWMDEHLFNGEYYEQKILPPQQGRIAPGLALRAFTEESRDPGMQIGAGCFSDQLVGQYMAHVCGLGHLLDPRKVRAALRSVVKYNFRRHMFDVFNSFRAFALNDEAALLYGTYPKGTPAMPCFRFAEVWNGVEYQVAAHLVYEGMEKKGVELIQSIRERFDGRKRNPFDEPECGHHYARSMASWASVVALTGFQYSAVDGTMTFAVSKGRHFWSTGSAWGTCMLRPVASGVRVKLQVVHGEIQLRCFRIAGLGEVLFAPRRRLRGQHTESWTVRRSL